MNDTAGFEDAMVMCREVVPEGLTFGRLGVHR